MKFLVNLVLMLWELPRQMIMCIATPSEEWEKIQKAKRYEEIYENCPGGSSAFEVTLKQEDFE